MKKLILVMVLLSFCGVLNAQTSRLKWDNIASATIPENVRDLASAPMGIVGSLSVLAAYPMQLMTYTVTEATTTLSFYTLELVATSVVLLSLNGMIQNDYTVELPNTVILPGIVATDTVAMLMRLR